ncbi:hypothetical protein B0T24DRAFT_421789 [Lasiosphaeria ovina]|uniref:Uncharacterized protein n=1 Tax=Lasiosphaeria ovina TaxID=92902 RepID=A0AAE0JVV5_9PEZI|nr:hypothetical protein B0T24DRAFT_421789 [Lasiosphaeria ovina]
MMEGLGGVPTPNEDTEFDIEGLDKTRDRLLIVALSRLAQSTRPSPEELQSAWRQVAITFSTNPPENDCGSFAAWARNVLPQQLIEDSLEVEFASIWEDKRPTLSKLEKMQRQLALPSKHLLCLYFGSTLLVSSESVRVLEKWLDALPPEDCNTQAIYPYLLQAQTTRVRAMPQHIPRMPIFATIVTRDRFMPADFRNATLQHIGLLAHRRPSAGAEEDANPVPPSPSGSQHNNKDKPANSLFLDGQQNKHDEDILNNLPRRNLGERMRKISPTLILVHSHASDPDRPMMELCRAILETAVPAGLQPRTSKLILFFGPLRRRRHVRLLSLALRL